MRGADLKGKLPFQKFDTFHHGSGDPVKNLNTFTFGGGNEFSQENKAGHQKNLIASIQPLGPEQQNLVSKLLN